MQATLLVVSIGAVWVWEYLGCCASPTAYCDNVKEVIRKRGSSARLSCVCIDPDDLLPLVVICALPGAEVVHIALGLLPMAQRRALKSTAHASAVDACPILSHALPIALAAWAAINCLEQRHLRKLWWLPTKAWH